jgi:hypothetical protein
MSSDDNTFSTVSGRDAQKQKRMIKSIITSPSPVPPVGRARGTKRARPPLSAVYSWSAEQCRPAATRVVMALEAVQEEPMVDGGEKAGMDMGGVGHGIPTGRADGC